MRIILNVNRLIKPRGQPIPSCRAGPAAGIARRPYPIKLHRHSGKVSYLAYPDFETNPHPTLLRSVKLSLRTREIDCLEYQATTNPPILHRKESFLSPDYPLHAKFAKLTHQEEKHGLPDDTATIGTRDGWLARLNAVGFALRGYRLVASSNR